MGVRGLTKSDGVTARFEFPLLCGLVKLKKVEIESGGQEKTIQEFEMKIIAKDGTITRVPGIFQGYETSEEESVERPRERDLYEFVNHPQLQQRSHRNEFAPHWLPQSSGNMNGWLVEDEDEVERNEVDSDLESTASSKPVWEKTTKDDRDFAMAILAWNDFKALMIEEFCPSNEMEKLENEFQNHKMVGANHAAYTDRFHELAKLVPHLVTPESSRIKRYIAGLAPEIRGMLRATQPTTIQNVILRELGLWRQPLLEMKLQAQVLSVASVILFIQKTDLAMCALIVRNRVILPGIVGHCRNNRSNGNQVRGRAFNVNVNAMEAVQDPKVVTGTFSLNDHFVTILFDSGADFSFISTEFAPLLNVRPSIVNPGYVIEVADGKKVEVDRIIYDCKLELGLCHEKVVEIPVEDGRILRVHGERDVGITKALKSAKEDEPRLSDISVVCEFEDVFPEDLLGLPPQ
ncbi:putative reverse transcriptase domain-containing protein [Tanacetum coccineum]